MGCAEQQWVPRLADIMKTLVVIIQNILNPVSILADCIYPHVSRVKCIGHYIN